MTQLENKKKKKKSLIGPIFAVVAILIFTTVFGVNFVLKERDNSSDTENNYLNNGSEIKCEQMQLDDNTFLLQLQQPHNQMSDYEVAGALYNSIKSIKDHNFIIDMVIPVQLNRQHSRYYMYQWLVIVRRH